MSVTRHYLSTGKPTSPSLNARSDLSLLFVYFQVNTGVSYFLDYYVEDIYHTMIVVFSVPVSILNPNPMSLPRPLLIAVLRLTHPVVTKVTRVV